MHAKTAYSALPQPHCRISMASWTKSQLHKNPPPTPIVAFSCKTYPRVDQLTTPRAHATGPHQSLHVDRQNGAVPAAGPVQAHLYATQHHQ